MAGGCGGISPISTTSWPGSWARGRAPAAGAPGRVLNIGNNQSETVLRLVELLEGALGRQAVVRDVARPLSDVAETFADIDAIGALTGFAPRTGLPEGIARFAAWFRVYHGGE